MIKWVGYGPESNTWEPEKHLKNCNDLIQEYWDTVRLREEQRGTNTRPCEQETDENESSDVANEETRRRSDRLAKKRKVN